MRRIYLDHAATTRTAPEVIDAVVTAMEDDWGNASSSHSAGQSARRTVDTARIAVASLIGAKPEEIYFTSGATESVNWAVGLAPEFIRGRGDRLVSSAIEHPCGLESSRRAEARGWKAVTARVDSGGVLDLASLQEALAAKTSLVSVMLANNETGAIQPVQEAARLAHEAGALFHTDATQAIGRIRVNVADLGADYLSLSAHKFYGPKGVGALFVRKGAPLEPFMRGGEQEKGKRAGTFNVPGIAGMGVAAEMAVQELDKRAAHARAIRDALEGELVSRVKEAEINGCREPRLPSHLNICFPRVDAEALLMALDVAGIAASTGSACASGTSEPSHVLVAMGLPRARALSSVRFTTGEENLAEDSGAAAEAVAAAVERIRRSSPRAL
jgi:cysteine desulfurase